jgi:hypothetical protein
MLTRARGLGSVLGTVPDSINAPVHSTFSVTPDNHTHITDNAVKDATAANIVANAANMRRSVLHDQIHQTTAASASNR